MKNLNKIRKERKMSQIALATKLGVAQETISAYENGKAFPSIETLLRLCSIFNVSSDFLLDKTDVRYPVNDFCDKNISAEELELIGLFRKMSFPQRNKLLGFAMGLSE